MKKTVIGLLLRWVFWRWRRRNKNSNLPEYHPIALLDLVDKLPKQFTRWGGYTRQIGILIKLQKHCRNTTHFMRMLHLLRRTIEAGGYLDGVQVTMFPEPSETTLDRFLLTEKNYPVLPNELFDNLVEELRLMSTALDKQKENPHYDDYVMRRAKWILVDAQTIMEALVKASA